MKNYWIWILIAIVLVGGYFYFTNKPVEDSDTINSMEVMLSALNDSGVSGSATLTEQDGDLMVALALTGNVAGTVMPAHIHDGVCPGVGAVKYPLTSATDGSSTTIIEGVTLANLESMLPLAINVHLSADQISTYVACGSLAF
ncbi:MAG TPA: hypothetical protein VI432_01475 [Candidatus Paceibacterota bacterium]